MVADKPNLKTADELLQRASDLGRCELLDGVLVELPYRTFAEGRALTHLSTVLWGFVEAGSLGQVLLGDTGVVLGRNPDRVRAPSLCFISHERLPVTGVDDGFLQMAPDLAIEVNSSLDQVTDWQQKTEEWLRAGVRLVLNINPQTKIVVASQFLDSDRIYHIGDVLPFVPVLPGFSIPVADLFR